MSRIGCHLSDINRSSASTVPAYVRAARMRDVRDRAGPGGPPVTPPVTRVTLLVSLT
jgi:hypothetical protein